MSFHISIHIDCTLILLFFAQIFGQSMHLCYSCVSHDHDQLSYSMEGSKLERFTHACAQRSCSVIFVVNHSGAQPATQGKIQGMHICHTFHTGCALCSPQIPASSMESGPFTPKILVDRVTLNNRNNQRRKEYGASLWRMVTTPILD